MLLIENVNLEGFGNGSCTGHLCLVTECAAGNGQSLHSRHFHEMSVSGIAHSHIFESNVLSVGQLDRRVAVARMIQITANNCNVAIVITLLRVGAVTGI